MSEVKENEYNLNIPRYVDTLEEEEPVDLPGIIKALADLEEGMIEIDESIRGFCAELALRPRCDEREHE